VRWNAASGGAVTALLLCGIRNGVIDGAIVTGMSPQSPLKPLPYLARTEDEVRAAVGSKYCPVPVNLRLSEIMASEGRFALVGLPCHIHGLRKAQMLIPRLRRQVPLCISLFCGRVLSPMGTRVALKSRGASPEEVIEISYRGRGWPGSLYVRLRDGRELTEPLRSYYSRYFTSFFAHRCTLCSDGVGDLADISCGDAWLQEYESDNQGTSIVVVRTTRGRDLLSLALPDHLALLPLTPSKVIQSQERMLRFKKHGFQVRSALCKLVGGAIPVYQQSLPSAAIRDWLSAIKFYLKHWLYRRLARPRWRAASQQDRG